MEKIILDCDPGIDDAMAIAYALHSPEVELTAITTCFGNAHTDVTTKNALDLLALFDASHVPVYEGLNQTIDGQLPREGAPWIHGHNGIGEVTIPTSQKKAENESAHDFLSRITKEHPGELTLVPVGSLSNVARAIKADPEFVKNVKEIVVMGGAVRHPGNITPLAEANIHADPKAANIVFQSGANIRLVGLDVTMKTLLPQDKCDEWRSRNQPSATSMADIVTFYINAYKENNPGIIGCSLHDPLAIGTVIDPSFVQTVPMKVTVGEAGESYGQTVGEEDEASSVHVCLHVDSERFVAHFLSRVV
ncbi:nucleoside hydrolase [Aureibacillus halotolerans]|uniref:Purine nucleosidase n=1 Tax=Aureibacillus halotolerans TaxID=1508390 RepID=A0A4R6U6R2_9BACI|nr:nucleoside hydrolase [Aureibacillus halotolerans]TDQ41981.1 purine nucleosidase [Aureibacillus halotolerans]